ncbi:MAG: diguanylate cyclase [Candidatus Accumulibacter sp.]|jgi:diguanylate cyclase (GGDEF)-like protein|nr:diguanylate cyclase [Accumulibacter sp.]
MRPEEVADQMFRYMGLLLYDPGKAELDVEALPKEFQPLGKGLVFFASMLVELRAFAYGLARGNLAVKPPSSRNELASPLKSLHANLKHLTWQTQRIAQGDYQQRVDFMGDFANAFNQMVTQLDEQRSALMSEIEAGKQKTYALEQNVGMFEAITLNIPQWIMVLDMTTAETLFANRTVSAMFDDHPPLAESLRAWMDAQAAYMKGLENHGGSRLLNAKIAAEERNWYLSVSIYPLVWRNRQAAAFIFTDLSHEREQLQELEHVAYQDALTGVTSRYHGLQILDEWIATHQEFCICFVDMDNLKYVNDTFGHTVGDDYIINVANVLGRFSSDVFVSRLGGDEFMLLQKDWSEQQAEARMRELRAELIQQAATSKISYIRSISYGLVYVPKGNAVTASDLLGIADDRMYRFKRAHKAHR